MTRINCVPVECLTDKHLRGEYKEITRPFNKVIERIEKYGVHDALHGCSIGARYTLNAGHETFFFNKLLWVHTRYNILYHELCRRGYKIDHAKQSKISFYFWDILCGVKLCWNNWQPTPEDMYLNMARLARNSKLKNVLTELERENE